jgi:hypothetical protein
MSYMGSRPPAQNADRGVGSTTHRLSFGEKAMKLIVLYVIMVSAMMFWWLRNVKAERRV